MGQKQIELDDILAIEHLLGDDEKSVRNIRSESFLCRHGVEARPTATVAIGVREVQAA